MPEPSRTCKRKLLHLLVIEMGQTCKVVLDPVLLGPPDQHGIPEFILQQFAHGIPLDLNPRYPLELDLDEDPKAFLVSLSFKGVRHRCRIPWRACGIMGVGFLGVNWENEEGDEVAARPAPRPVPAPRSTPHAGSRGSVPRAPAGPRPADTPATLRAPRAARPAPPPDSERPPEPPPDPAGGGARKRAAHLKLVK